MAKRTTRKTTARKKATTTRRKTTARKTTARKTTARKTTARKKTTSRAAKKTTTAARKPAKITSARGKARSKSEIYSVIADHVGITKKEVAAVFDTMGQIIEADLKKGAVGAFNVPGMMKVVVQNKKAVKARKGINPFTGEEQMFKAKPARRVVKVRPLQGLKALVA
ncbi:MAG: HU family DNA-binding protein [Phycisphaerales bacterium JB059]